MTTPGERSEKILRGANPFASTGFETTTVEGTDERASGSRTSTVCGPRVVPAARLDGEQHPSRACRRGKDAEGDYECRAHAPWMKAVSTADFIPFVRGPPARAPAASAVSTSVKRVDPGRERSSIRPPISSASSRAIASPRPLPDATVPAEAYEALEDRVSGLRAGSPGRRRSTDSVARPSSPPDRDRHRRPGRRVDDRVLDQDPSDLEHAGLVAARVDQHRSPSSSSTMPGRRRARTELRREHVRERRRGRCRRPRPPDDPRRSATGRAGRSRASSGARPGRASRRGTRRASRRRPRRSSSSSRNPASEKSGVRSSCEAFAMNSPRARSSVASCSRIRSKARASWPSSSGASIDDRLVEAAVGDPLGRSLEPPDPAREQGREDVAEHDRERRREARRRGARGPDDRRPSRGRRGAAWRGGAPVPLSETRGLGVGRAVAIDGAADDPARVAPRAARAGRARRRERCRRSSRRPARRAAAR